MKLLLMLPGVGLALWLVYAFLPTLWYKYGRRRGLRARLGGPGTLLLTFDDGPHPAYTERLLDLLAAHEVRAVFFLLAENAARYPRLVARMRRAGHEVALHGQGHANMWFLGPRGSAAAVRQGLRGLERLGCRPRYYRPPYGNLNLCTLYVCRKSGLEILLYDVMVQDWRAGASVDGLVAKLEARTGAGAVICLHDNGAGGAAPGAPLCMIAALAAFIPARQSRGCRFQLPAGAEAYQGGPP